jgi:hypothetical protein
MDDRRDGSLERKDIGPSNRTMVSSFALRIQSATSHVCFNRPAWVTFGPAFFYVRPYIAKKLY